MSGHVGPARLQQTTVMLQSRPVVGPKRACFVGGRHIHHSHRCLTASLAARACRVLRGDRDGTKCGGGDFQRFGLPSEAVNRVLRFLAPEELSRVACTSRVMRALADCPTLWKPLVMLHFRARVRTGRLRSFLPVSSTCMRLRHAVCRAHTTLPTHQKGVENPAVPWKQVYSACRRRWNARVASIRKRRQVRAVVVVQSSCRSRD